MKVEFDFGEVPEDTIPGVSIGIVVFYDREGSIFYGLATKGEADAAHFVGVLEHAKHRMLTGMHNSPDEDL